MRTSKTSRLLDRFLVLLLMAVFRHAGFVSRSRSITQAPSSTFVARSAKPGVTQSATIGLSLAALISGWSQTIRGPRTPLS